MSSLENGNTVFVALSYVVTAVFSLWLFTFWRLRNEDWVRQRRPILVLAFGIMFIIDFATERVTSILWSQSECCVNPFDGWKAIQVLLATAVGTGCYWVVFARVWLVYYDIKFNLAIAHNEWKSHIDPNSPKTNWFLKHRTTFGNVRWVVAYVAIWITTLTAMDTIDVWVTGRFNRRERAVISFSYLISGLHIMAVLFKLPKYNDAFGIRRETFWLAVSAVTAGLMFAVIFLFLMPQPPSWGYLLAMCSFSLGLIGLALLSIPFSLYKGGLPLTPWGFREYFQPSNVRKRCASMIGIVIASSQQRNPSIVRIKLQSVLQSFSGFKLFASHLCSEFSIENLLFLVETSQFMDRLLKVMTRQSSKDDIMDIQRSCSINLVSFPLRKLPKSQIVNNTVEMSKSNHSRQLSSQRPNETIAVDFVGKEQPSPDAVMPSKATELNNSASSQSICVNYDHWQQCRLLYDKYIAQGSTFEVNISSSNRGKLYRIFSDNSDGNGGGCEQMQLSAVLCIFDDSRLEVWKLMLDSYSRFKRTDAFLSWSQHHDV